MRFVVVVVVVVVGIRITGRQNPVSPQRTFHHQVTTSLKATLNINVLYCTGTLRGVLQ